MQWQDPVGIEHEVATGRPAGDVHESLTKVINLLRAREEDQNRGGVHVAPRFILVRHAGIPPVVPGTRQNLERPIHISARLTDKPLHQLDDELPVDHVSVELRQRPARGSRAGLVSCRSGKPGEPLILGRRS